MIPVSITEAVGEHTNHHGRKDFDELMEWYAAELLGQTPCMRMMDNSGRKRLYNDPNLKGVIYHTVKFCDFYSFEYAQVKQNHCSAIIKDRIRLYGAEQRTVIDEIRSICGKHEYG